MFRPPRLGWEKLCSWREFPHTNIACRPTAVRAGCLVDTGPGGQFGFRRQAGGQSGPRRHGGGTGQTPRIHREDTLTPSTLTKFSSLPLNEQLGSKPGKFLVSIGLHKVIVSSPKRTIRWRVCGSNQRNGANLSSQTTSGDSFTASSTKVWKRFEAHKKNTTDHFNLLCKLSNRTQKSLLTQQSWFGSD